jgi:hypothetical protein
MVFPTAAVRRVSGHAVDGTRKIAILLVLAAAVPATAQTFGFSLGSAPRNVCLSIDAVTYRLSDVRPDYTVRIDPNAQTPDVRVHLATTPDDADFVLVDDGTAPAACQTRATTVRVSATAPTPDLVVGFAASMCVRSASRRKRRPRCSRSRAGLATRWRAAETARFRRPH